MTSSSLAGTARRRWAPYVAGSHVVAEGETLADIAAAWSTDPWVMAGFNGLSDVMR